MYILSILAFVVSNHHYSALYKQITTTVQLYIHYIVNRGQAINRLDLYYWLLVLCFWLVSTPVHTATHTTHITNELTAIYFSPKS